VSAALDAYLGELERRLRVGHARRVRAIEEARDHLAEFDLGDDELAAAIERFGSPSVVARSFNAGHSTRVLRRAPALGVLIGASIFLSAAIAARSSATPWRAPTAAVVLFSSAVVAAQLALAAGLILCGRLAASVGERTISERESRLARRSALLLYVSEAAAALLLVATIVVDVVVHGPVRGELVVGLGALLLCGAVGLGAAWRYGRFTPTSVGPLDEESVPAPSRFAWRAFDLVQRRPALSCALVAGLAAVGSANHAETSLLWSLPWALGQAVVVVVAFVGLRGWLGLAREDVEVATG
jgi:hypothetical protein